MLSPRRSRPIAAPLQQPTDRHKQRSAPAFADALHVWRFKPNVSVRLRVLNALGRFRVDHLRLGGYATIADRDLTGLLRFGNLAHEIDVQETVLESGALDLNMVGELEGALESASRDALVEHLVLGLLILLLFLALDGQGVFLRLEREFFLAEAGHRDRDAIVVLAGTLDVVRRIARRGLKAVAEHVEQPVETDGRTIKRCKIESSHKHILLFERHAGRL